MITNVQTYDSGISNKVHSQSASKTGGHFLSMFRQRYVRLEIAFWCFAIPLLQDSPFLRLTISRIYPMFQTLRWLFNLPRPILWMITGLTVGFMIGFLGGVILP